ncbi:MAG: metal-dependent transcriptional regulator [Anaerolineales bacterium]|nr:metal-dependent transcriptional regulator [Anaerolineales bacterium]
MQTQTVEDYLKSIYEIQHREGRVATTTLAKHMNVTAASVTGMMKKLAGMKLVTYERHKGVELTEAGEKIALEVIRHHRLIERYLSEALGVPWDQVDAEAEKWEHVLSDDIESRIDALLGYPTKDPHGAPIPSREGHIQPSSNTRLTDLGAGQRAIVVEVSDHDPELLRYLGTMGLYPNVEVSIIDIAPFDGPLTLKIGDEEYTLGREAASHILIATLES